LSVVLFFVGESFFVLRVLKDGGGGGGVSFRDITVRSARFGDRFERGGSREVLAVFSEISFFDVLSAAALFSCFTDFFGLSTEL
jgi:hypothetical protein